MKNPELNNYPELNLNFHLTNSAKKDFHKFLIAFITTNIGALSQNKIYNILSRYKYFLNSRIPLENFINTHKKFSDLKHRQTIDTETQIDTASGIVAKFSFSNIKRIQPN